MSEVLYTLTLYFVIFAHELCLTLFFSAFVFTSDLRDHCIFVRFMLHRTFWHTQHMSFYNTAQITNVVFSIVDRL